MSNIRDALQQSLGPTYTVERELGGGGMSRVFVAFDQALGRRVVAKVLSPELTASVYAERFMREILVVATLQHPHIVGVLTAGDADGLPYFTMPYVEGNSLRDLIRRSGPMAVRDAVPILRDVARALMFAHERGVVHRDIKPDNVLLASGSAMVTDFGVAKAVLSAQRAQPVASPDSATLTIVGTTVGTPAYMAPEQIAADPDVDHRADIYAFGVMAYEMLAGAPPFKSTTPHAILAAHLSQPPRPLDAARAGLPPRLVQLVMACLEKDRDQRPQSARELVEALEDPAVISDAAVATLSMPRYLRRRRVRRVAIGVAAAVALVAGGLFLRSRYGASGRMARRAVAAAADASAGKSVLVVPFVNLSADSSDAYLADGITSELVSALTHIPGLRVASRTAGTLGRDRFPTEQELGATYKVDYVLEGTVQRDKNRLRIAARLVGTRDGFSVWADVFDRTVSDVFAVQQDISSSIAAALSPQLATAPQALTLADRGTRDDTAFDLYMRGRYLLGRRTGPSLRRALGYLGQATARDTTFARAYSAAAHAYSLLPPMPGEVADSVHARGVAAATRALALDSTLAEAYAARAALYAASFRWTEAERDYRSAIRISPQDAAAHAGLGQLLLLLGRVGEGVSELRQAVTLDTTVAVNRSEYAVALAMAGRDSAAIANAHRGVALDSASATTRRALGLVFLLTGRPDSARAPLEGAAGLSPDRDALLGLLGYAAARSGDALHARQLRESAARSRDPGALFSAAQVAVGLGDTTLALAHLEAAVHAHAPQFAVESLAESIFDPLRGSGRFADVVRSLGLPSVLARPATAPSP